MRRKLTIVLVILSALFFASSSYIKKKVEEGKVEVVGAQKKVDRGSSLFSTTPLGEKIGEEVSSPFQKKIDAGKEKIATFETISFILTILGSLCVFLILLNVFFKKTKK